MTRVMLNLVLKGFVIWSKILVELLREKIGQNGITLDLDFCYSFYFSSSLFFRRGEKKGKEYPKTWSKVMPFCSIARKFKSSNQTLFFLRNKN